MLNFLKELPDRYLLVLGFFSVMGFYALFQSDAILQLMINFAVAIIALSQKKQESQTNNNIDTLNTPSVTAGSMDQANISTENVNLTDKKQEQE